MIHFEKEDQMTDKNFERIATSRIFQGANADSLRASLEGGGCEILQFEPAQVICEPQTLLKSIGIILSGTALVLSADSDRRVLLRRLMPSDIFGVSSVFAKDPVFVSRISAKSACTVAFISAERLSALIEGDRAILYNYIEFLSDRIRFLNKKIRFFTSGSAERRLALYLDSFGEDTFRLEESMSSIADMLDIGRASLYRAFDRLTSDGFIQREKDSVTVFDRVKMINYYNDK